jgi:hypothetical protein
VRPASIVGVAAVLGLVACTSSSPSIVLATYSPVTGTDAVGLVGTISVHSGCVMLRTEGPSSSFVMLVWPSGFAVGSDDQGEATVLDESGQVAATVGDRVNLGGGPTSGAATSEVPASCKTDHMFRVSQIDLGG